MKSSFYSFDGPFGWQNANGLRMNHVDSGEALLRVGQNYMY